MSLLTTLSVALALVFGGGLTAMIAQPLAPYDTWFAYHPTLLTACFLVVTPLGISYMHPRQPDRATRMSRHSFLQFIAFALCAVGIYAIYVTKEAYQKDHMTSWHGTFGYAAAALCDGMLVSGVLLNVVRPGSFLRPPRMLHRLFGFLTLALACTALFVAADEGYFANYIGEDAQHIMLVKGGIVLTLVLAVLPFILK